MRYRWAQALNRWLGRHLMSSASSPNETGDQTGVISKLFFISWIMGQQRRRFKAWNRTAYRISKLALMAGLVALLIYL